MRLASLILMVLIAVQSPARGQVSTDEAYQRLRERQKQREAEQAQAATQPSATTRPSGLAVGQLLHQAWGHIVAKRYAQAAPLFDKLLKLDSRDANALEGRGVCRYEQSQYKSAEKDAQEAFALFGRAAPGHPPRQAVIAAAVTSIMNDNPMHAVKLARDYMEPLEADGKLDEEMQNILGTALWRANAQARKLPLYAESGQYYQAYDAKLAEQKNDGTKRWGDQWLPASEADANWKRYTQARNTVEAAITTLDRAGVALNNARNDYVDVHGLRLHTQADFDRANNGLKHALKNRDAAQAGLNNALHKFDEAPQPPFPKKIEPDWKEPG